MVQIGSEARGGPLETPARRWGSRAGLAVFVSQFVGVDLVVRGAAAWLREPRSLVNAAQSVAVWYALAALASRRPSRAALAVGSAALVVSELLFYRFYHAVIDRQVIASAVHAWSDVRPIAVRMAPGWLALVALVAAAEWGLLSLCRRLMMPTERERARGARRARGLVVALLVVSGGTFFAAPISSATPEFKLFHSLGLLWAPAEAASHGQGLADVVPSDLGVAPNVLLIVTESVRASDYCSAFDAGCTITPEVNRLLPDRIALPRMRATASYTAISLSALLTGQAQGGTRAEILAAPSLFDFVGALRLRGKKPTTAYWSDHSRSVFEGRPVERAVDSFFTVEDLLGHGVEDDDDVVVQGLDRELARHAEENFPRMRPPYLAFVHFSGTHAPYYVDPERAPFQPSQREVTWAKMPLLHNTYRNAIFEQDRSVARVVRAFIAAQGSAPYVIFFTSDHGEAFGEHSAIHHGQNLFAEQTHVPAWIALGPGALTDAQIRTLRANAAQWVTHFDVVPTVLDVYAAYDSFALASHRAKFAGRSLLRETPPGASPVWPLRNCTALFPCPLNNWGVMGPTHLLSAQPWNDGWLCSRLDDEGDAAPFDDPACVALRAASRGYFDRLPNGRPNGG